jgi:hypothetical protein
LAALAVPLPAAQAEPYAVLEKSIARPLEPGPNSHPG